MVAVRSAHLNKAGEFDPQKWIASLGISSQQSCERLTETWAYCLRTQGIPTPICCCGAAWRWWKSCPC
jgi:GTP pyrophosphokinase